MSKENSHIDYFELIPRYLSGEASEAEVSLLEDWVRASPENKRDFQAYKKAWILSGMQQNKTKVDVEKQWQTTADQLFPPAQVRTLPQAKRRSLAAVWKIAAAIALLVAASLWWFRLGPATNGVQLVAEQKAEEKQLPDGSTISLNQYASLAYAADFDVTERRVALTGDAYFEVERNTEKPFIIEAGPVEVKVLGTSFYVDSRPEETEVQVMVTSGVVEVNAGGESVELTANQTAVFSKNSQQLLRKTTEDNNFLGWKNQFLTFEDALLRDVVFSLNRNFHANIRLANPVLDSCKITSTFKDKTLDNIIRIIEQTMTIKANYEGDEIIFSGDACK